ncbi:MAG TPA: 6-phospho-beta-glucosidase, partial [Candidatus Nesterenkonia stercoripullorum]|nr:6-phospho-beta-glucosidase [Candidatus Nesterenkonia stercoripullorum]
SRILDAGTTRGEFLVQQQQAYYQRLSGTPPQGVGSSRHATGTAEGAPGSSPLAIWRAALHERESTYMAESRDDERREEDIAGGGYQEVALRLMTALAMNRPERMILDVGNTVSARSTPAEATAGTTSVPETRVIPGLPAETVIEVPCIVDGDGVHPERVAPVELDRLGLMARVRGAERLILEAATSGDQDSAWRGFATHPLVSSPDLGRRLLDGYLHRDPHIARVLGRTALQ